MKDKHLNSFEIKVDINNAGDARTLTIVSEGEKFSILLNEINIAQMERLTTEKGSWHVRFSNLCEEDMQKVKDAIDLHFPRNEKD